MRALQGRRKMGKAPEHLDRSELRASKAARAQASPSVDQLTHKPHAISKHAEPTNQLQEELHRLRAELGVWREKARQFELMSITDPLTGLRNRRYLEERLAEELSRSERHSFAMSFLMIDIDDFKRYNDRYGHQTADRALRIIAGSLKSVLRKADVASRYGGEEFCVLLPQTAQREAIGIAERIQRKIEEAFYCRGGSQAPGPLTVSVGISSFSKTLRAPEAIIRAADSALYQAKSQGKNRVCAYQDLHTASF